MWKFRAFKLTASDLRKKEIKLIRAMVNLKLFKLLQW